VEEFGSMELLLSFISIVSIFVFLQLETSVQRFFYEMTDSEIKVFVSSVLAFVSFFGILVASILSIFSAYFAKLLFMDSHKSILVLWAVWQVPLICFYTFATIIFRFCKKYDVFLKIIILSSACSVLLLSYFIIYRNEGVFGFFKAQLISLIVVVTYAFYNLKFFLVKSISFKSLSTAFTYALPQMPARIGNTLNTYANRFFVNHYVNSYGLGLFAMANKIGSVFQILYQVFLMFWSQMMFEILLKENHREIFVSILKLATPILFLLVSLITVLSSDILNLLSVKFVGGHYLIGVISFSIVLSILKEIVDVGPKYLKKTHYLSVNFVISAVINIVILAWLVPVFALNAVSLALLLSSGALFVTSWYVSNRLYHIPFDKGHFIINLIPCLIVLTMDTFQLIDSYLIKIVLSSLVLCMYSLSIYKAYNRFILIYAM